MKDKKSKKTSDNPLDIWPPPQEDIEKKKEEARKKRLNVSYHDYHEEMQEELGAPVFDIEPEESKTEDEQNDERDDDDKNDKDKE